MKWISVILVSLVLATSVYADTTSDLIGCGMPPLCAEQIGAKSFVPSADDTYDLGSSTAEWKDIYIDGVAYVDAFGQSLVPNADDSLDLGTASVEWKDAYFDGTVTTDGIVNSSTLNNAANIILSVTGATLQIEDDTAASSCIGGGTFNGTTAVTISTTCVGTGDYVFLTPTSDPTGSTAAYCWVTNIQNGTSFDVDCDQANDGTFSWWVVKQN